MISEYQRALALTAIVLALAIGACGRKGPPVAPERRVPLAVGDLDGVVRAAGIDLTWTVPRRRVDQTKLTGPSVTRLFRLEDVGQGDPRPAILANDRIAGYTLISTIPLNDPASPVAQSGRMSFNDRALTFGRRYTYVVVTTDPEGRTSAPSRRLTLAYVAAPEPPRDLAATPGERQVHLSWRPPARLTDGGPADVPLVYEVLRAGAADGAAAVVARTEPGATSATDSGLIDDRTYYYAVRAIRREGAAVVEGEASPRIAATPTDRTPPRPAAALVAIPSEGTVRLSWTPSPDGDVAGYVVYRAEGGGPFTRVGSVRAPATTFTDREVPPGAYRYAVTAQDGSVRANESARSDEARVTVP